VIGQISFDMMKPMYLHYFSANVVPLPSSRLGYSIINHIPATEYKHDSFTNTCIVCMQKIELIQGDILYLVVIPIP
jgi:hypothetical protein